MAKGRDRAERQQQIIEAAFGVFAEKGYHKATLSEIARTAGMGQGTLYYYYKTKDELFWGVYDAMMTGLAAVLEEQLSAVDAPREQLQCLLDQLLLQYPEVGVSSGASELSEAVARFSGFSRVLAEFWLHAERTDQMDHFFQKVTAYQRDVISRLVRLFDALDLQPSSGLSREQLAHLILAVRDGISLQIRMGLLGRYSGLPESVYGLIVKGLLGADQLADGAR